MKKILLFSLISFLLGACASTPSTISTNDQKSLGRVGFVSLVDDHIQLTYQGTTLFENKEQVAHLPVLGVQAFAAKTLADVLTVADISRLSIQDQRIELTKFLKKSKDERIPYKFDFNSAQPFLEKIADSLKLDSVMILYADAFYEESYTKKTSFKEIGVLFRSFLGAQAQFVHTPVSVVVYNIKEKRILAKTRNNRPIVEIQDLKWKDNPKNYSAEDLKMVKEAIYSKLKENIIAEIQELNLSK